MRVRFAAAVATAALLAACSSTDAPSLTTPDPTGAPATTTRGAVTTTSTTVPVATTTSLADAGAGPVRAPNGRAAPRPATTPTGLAAQIEATERALRDPATNAEARPDLGHLNQVAYRTLAGRPEWDAAVLDAVAGDLRPVVQAHLLARREFQGMRTTVADTVPAWAVIEPEPVDALLGYYKEAQAATGIEWTYLAAINLVETGLGRIDGLSTANAIGPMQFLQSTWDERGIGEGDIRNPRDAIAAAARYLVRRGGPADMPAALQGYNNHIHYVRAVEAYASLFRADERAFHVVYEWEIYYFSTEGDLWFPVGYREPVSVPASDYVARAPWSAPPT